jgi:hypothetical protein
MQYHYVVWYDTEEEKWEVESDMEIHFPKGNVWSPDGDYEECGHSFFFPEKGTPEYVLDESLWRTLLYIVDTFPIPQEAS